MISYKKSVALLATGQALLLTNGIMLVSINGLLGLQLSPDRRLATLPITTYVLGGALATLPAAFFMKRYGRRAGFMLGGTLGMLGALISAIAVHQGSFWLLCLGTICAGVYNAFGQQFRFASADAAPVEWKSRAISLTLAGGILGGISTGQPIVARFAVKPTSSILAPRRTIDRSGAETEIVTKGRHDPCVGIRAVPVGEAMMALVLADQALRHRAQIG